MKYVVFVLIGLLAALVALGIYVRVAPSKAAVWHKPSYPSAPGVQEGERSYQVTQEIDADQARDILSALDRIIMATPRTTVLAGSIEEGMITYITRTALMRYPDYTTVYAGPDDTAEGSYSGILRVFGRARFGKLDMGVNKARVQGWMDQLNEARP